MRDSADCGDTDRIDDPVADLNDKDSNSSASVESLCMRLL